MRTIKSIFDEYAEIVPKISDELVASIMTENQPEKFFETIVQNIMLRFEDKQRLLEKTDLYARLVLLAEILEKETNILKMCIRDRRCTVRSFLLVWSWNTSKIPPCFTQIRKTGE